MTTTVLVYGPALQDTRAQAYADRWFLCDAHDVLIPATELSKLQQLDCSLYLGQLRLRAPGMLPLELLLDVIEDDDSVRCTASVGEQQVAAIDEGELAHTWFSQFLGRSVRCLKVDPEAAQTIEWPAQA
ncbi:MAG TPA: MOSC N-terminal beta barrel domain-containing protein [Paenalcaligenes sp.]|nr:MOSC N-terminal beta barrel domain-containing protein [Paenalcaligenes sp.]